MKIYNLSKKKVTHIGTYLIYLTNTYHNNFCFIRLNIFYDKHNITKIGNFFVAINILKGYRINQIPSLASLLNYIQYNFANYKA